MTNNRLQELLNLILFCPTSLHGNATKNEITMLVSLIRKLI